MHTWPHVCSLFKVDASTLWRWCRRADITPHQDPSDYRRRYLTDDQLIHLARLHHRVLVLDSDAVRLNEIERLEARIAELESKASQH